MRVYSCKAWWRLSTTTCSCWLTATATWSAWRPTAGRWLLSWRRWRGKSSSWQAHRCVAKQVRCSGGTGLGHVDIAADFGTRACGGKWDGQSRHSVPVGWWWYLCCVGPGWGEIETSSVRGACRCVAGGVARCVWWGSVNSVEQCACYCRGQ